MEKVIHALEEEVLRFKGLALIAENEVIHEACLRKAVLIENAAEFIRSRTGLSESSDSPDGLKISEK